VGAPLRRARWNETTPPKAAMPVSSGMQVMAEMVAVTSDPIAIQSRGLAAAAGGVVGSEVIGLSRIVRREAQAVKRKRPLCP
jgi:hypothetical protein